MKRPDWFLVRDVPRLYEGTDLRDSYVVWLEGEKPLVVIELLSPGTEKEDLDKYALDNIELTTTSSLESIANSESKQNDGQIVKETPPNKWHVYEWILRVPYYAVYNRYTNHLRVFLLEGGRYRECITDSGNPRFWMRGLKLGLGIWQGEFEGMTRQWLRWYDSDGNWLLTDTELAVREAELEQQKRLKLTEKLRSLTDEQLKALGIDPQELE